jgi:dihydroorotate dehydrogenase
MLDPYARLRPLLFRLSPERAHTLVMGAARFAADHPAALRLLGGALAPADPRLAVHAFGLRFPNPLGLAAGFDKDGVAAAAWPAFGFGHAELGTVTTLPQEGNPRPRLFRIPADEAVINRMGFNNAGATALAPPVRRARGRPWWPDAPLGVNVGKSRAASLDEAERDYETSLRSVWPVADFLVLNVSSPNTPGLRELQGAERLAPLLALARALQGELGAKPVLLKVAPDLDERGLDDVATLAERHGLAGLVATNTTLSREGLRHDPGEAGGLSGRPLAGRSLAVLRALRSRTSLPIVAVGGITDADSAIERLEAGATLLQLYTGWIFGGPLLPRRILRALSTWLDGRPERDLDEYLARRDGRREGATQAV